jgi:O-antigen ligase
LALLAAWVIVSFVFRRPPLVAAVVALLLVAFSIVTGIADQASLALESGVRATGDWSGRLIIWPWAREVWAMDPWVGVGAGGFREINAYGVLAHNIILQTGTGLGIIGVALIVALIWSALAWKRTSWKQPKRALLVGAFLLASAPAYLSGVWETAPASWMVMAIFARLGVLGLDAPRQGHEDIYAVRPKPQKLPAWVQNGRPLLTR